MKTVTPAGYIPCPEGQFIFKFQPFVSWLKMIKNSKPKNSPKPGGAGFEEAMESVLDQAHEILILNPKR